MCNPLAPPFYNQLYVFKFVIAINWVRYGLGKQGKTIVKTTLELCLVFISRTIDVPVFSSSNWQTFWYNLHIVSSGTAASHDRLVNNRARNTQHEIKFTSTELPPPDRQINTVTFIDPVKRGCCVLFCDFVCSCKCLHKYSVYWKNACLSVH